MKRCDRMKSSNWHLVKRRFEPSSMRMRAMSPLAGLVGMVNVSLDEVDIAIQRLPFSTFNVLLGLESSTRDIRRASAT